MIKNPWKKLLRNVKLVAKRHNGYGYSFTDELSSHNERIVVITWEDLQDQFEKQNGVCYWFGTVLVPEDIFKKNYPLAMSVDRLDNSKGYEKDNIVITSRFANLGRGCCDQETFRKVVESIQFGDQGNDETV